MHFVNLGRGTMRGTMWIASADRARKTVEGRIALRKRVQMAAEVVEGIVEREVVRDCMAGVVSPARIRNKPENDLARYIQCRLTF